MYYITYIGRTANGNPVTYEVTTRSENRVAMYLRKIKEVGYTLGAVTTRKQEEATTDYGKR